MCFCTFETPKSDRPFMTGKRLEEILRVSVWSLLVRSMAEMGMDEEESLLSKIAFLCNFLSVLLCFPF